MPNSSALVCSASIWRALISSVTGTVGRRDVVVHRRDGEVGTADAAAGQAEAVERLRARDLVHEMQVDVEQVRLALGAMDDVALPDLLGERARACRSGSFLWSGGRARLSAATLFHIMELSSDILEQRG